MPPGETGPQRDRATALYSASPHTPLCKSAGQTLFFNSFNGILSHCSRFWAETTSALHRRTKLNYSTLQIKNSLLIKSRKKIIYILHRSFLSTSFVHLWEKQIDVTAWRPLPVGQIYDRLTSCILDHCASNTHILELLTLREKKLNSKPEGQWRLIVLYCKMLSLQQQYFCFHPFILFTVVYVAYFLLYLKCCLS